MNALRIRKYIDGPVPGIPELAPMVGKTVDIIVIEEPVSSSDFPGETSRQRVRLSGVIEAVTDGGLAFSLRLDTGDSLRIVGTSQSAVQSSELPGQRVAVDATATFADGDNLIAIEACSITPARAEDSYFSRPPRAVGRALRDSDLRRSQGADSGMSQVYGKWPGDESDEEVLRALEDIE